MTQLINCNFIIDDIFTHNHAVNEIGQRVADGMYCLGCYTKGFLVEAAQHPRTTVIIVSKLPYCTRTAIEVHTDATYTGDKPCLRPMLVSI